MRAPVESWWCIGVKSDRLSVMTSEDARNERKTRSIINFSAVYDDDDDDKKQPARHTHTRTHAHLFSPFVKQQTRWIIRDKDEMKGLKNVVSLVLCGRRDQARIHTRFPTLSAVYFKHSFSPLSHFTSVFRLPENIGTPSLANGCSHYLRTP